MQADVLQPDVSGVFVVCAQKAAARRRVGRHSHLHVPDHTVPDAVRVGNGAGHAPVLCRPKIIQLDVVKAQAGDPVRHQRDPAVSVDIAGIVQVIKPDGTRLCGIIVVRLKVHLDCRQLRALWPLQTVDFQIVVSRCLVAEVDGAGDAEVLRLVAMNLNAGIPDFLIGNLPIDRRTVAHLRGVGFPVQRDVQTIEILCLLQHVGVRHKIDHGIAVIAGDRERARRLCLHTVERRGHAIHVSCVIQSLVRQRRLGTEGPGAIRPILNRALRAERVFGAGGHRDEMLHLVVQGFAVSAEQDRIVAVRRGGALPRVHEADGIHPCEGVLHLLRAEQADGIVRGSRRHAADALPAERVVLAEIRSLADNAAADDPVDVLAGCRENIAHRH